MAYKQLSVWIDEDILAQFKKYCIETGRRRGWVLERAIKSYLGIGSAIPLVVSDDTKVYLNGVEKAPADLKSELSKAARLSVARVALAQAEFKSNITLDSSQAQ